MPPPGGSFHSRGLDFTRPDSAGGEVPAQHDSVAATRGLDRATGREVRGPVRTFREMQMDEGRSGRFLMIEGEPQRVAAGFEIAHFGRRALDMRSATDVTSKERYDGL